MMIAAIRSCGGSIFSTFLVNTTGASFVANTALRQRHRGYSSWINVKTQVPLHRRREVSLPVHSAVMSSSPAFSSAVENKQVVPLVVCGPSGVGKGTIINRFMEAQKSDQSLSGIPKFVFSVSHTTRQPREGEVDGVHYHFTTVDQMQKEIDDGKFIEHAEVHGNLYGSSFKSIDMIGSNQQCLLDIDVEGVRSIKEYQESRQQTDDNTMPILDPQFIFIAPPSIEVLKERLIGRGTETKETLERRFNNAKAELEYGLKEGNFNAIVVNDDLEQACEDFELAVKEMYEGTVHV